MRILFLAAAITLIAAAAPPHQWYSIIMMPPIHCAVLNMYGHHTPNEVITELRNIGERPDVKVLKNPEDASDMVVGINTEVAGRPTAFVFFSKLERCRTTLQHEIDEGNIPNSKDLD